MKRALIITYYWPPTGGSGVQRWVKFAKYLPQEGWQPVIYTPLNPEAITKDPSLEAEIPREAEIIKWKIFEPYEIYRALTGAWKSNGKASYKQKDEVNPINSGKKSTGKKISLWIRGNCFIPDPRCMWVRPSVRFLKKYLREHPVDVIVSTGPPHSMHLIAEKLSGATGIPWIADFRDPWTTMFYFKHLSLGHRAERIHKRLEKQVLDKATVVVAVSPSVKEEFESKTATPIKLVTNGFDECDFENTAAESDGYFNITHTGLFAADGNPETLWEVLSEKCSENPEFAKKLRIRLTGKTDREIIQSIETAKLGTNLVNLGYQPHSVAVSEQKAASLLILPLRKEPEYKATLPGKLFEYLASGNPILGIGQTDGAMAQIIDDTGAGTMSEWEDKDTISRCVDSRWKLFCNGTKTEYAKDIKRFSRRSLTHEMAALMDSLLPEQQDFTKQ